jgi:phage terminase small subunit
MSNDLTLKEQAFVEVYIANKGNGTQAAIAAGYSERSAHTLASRLLRKVEIKAAIERKTAKAFARYDVTPDKIVRELAKIGFSNVDDFIAKQEDGSVIIDLSTATPEQLAALTSIELDQYTDGRGANARGVKRVRFKLADKRQALMDLAKLARMLPSERVEHTGGIAQNVPVEGTHKIDVEALTYEQRDQLRDILLAAVALAEKESE